MLPPETLAGYLDDHLADGERRRVELHLASCAECRDEVADIRRLHAGQHRRRSIAVLIPALAAAVLLLAIAVPRQTTQPSAARSAGEEQPLLSVVSPTPDGVITRTPTFKWRSAGAGATYTITLQSSDGGVVWTANTADTLATLPDTVVLEPESVWYWSVDGLLPDGQSRSSGGKRFRTSP